MNSKKKGDVGMAMAIAHFASLGNTVCVPLTDSQKYDLVVEGDEGLKKVQVKTTFTRYKNDVFAVGLRTIYVTTGGKAVIKPFNADDVDLLFVHTGDGEKYVIPAVEIVVKNQLRLGLKCEQYKIGDVGERIKPHVC